MPMSLSLRPLCALAPSQCKPLLSSSCHAEDAATIWLGGGGQQAEPSFGNQLSRRTWAISHHWCTAVPAVMTALSSAQTIFDRTGSAGAAFKDFCHALSPCDDQLVSQALQL